MWVEHPVVVGVDAPKVEDDLIALVSQVRLAEHIGEALRRYASPPMALVAITY